MSSRIIEHQREVRGVLLAADEVAEVGSVRLYCCAILAAHSSLKGTAISTRSDLRTDDVIDLTQCAGNCASMMVPIGAQPV